MNINWKEIQDKYPNSYWNFEKFIIEEYKKGNCNDICYCDLEKFFDDNEIEIFIDRTILFYYYNIITKDYKVIVDNKIDNIRTRQEVKERAIYKAFEILEKKE